MTLAIRDVERIVRRRFDGEPSLSMLPLCNYAGRQLVSMNEWRWLLRPPATIRLRANVSWCDLPDDFGREVTPQDSSQPGWRIFRIVSEQRLAELRSANILPIGPYRFYGALVYAAAEGGGIKPRLELHPTPTEAISDTSLWYFAKWRELGDDDEVVPIPAYMEMLYIEIACAVVQGYDEHDLGSLADRLASIKLSPMFMDCVAEDALQTSSPERQMGGAVQSSRGIEEGWLYYPNGPVTLG
jgi:hypothetical protein